MGFSWGQGPGLSSCSLPKGETPYPLIHFIEEDPVFLEFRLGLLCFLLLDDISIYSPCHSHFMELGRGIFQVQEPRSQSVGLALTAETPLLLPVTVHSAYVMTGPPDGALRLGKNLRPQGGDGGGIVWHLGTP